MLVSGATKTHRRFWDHPSFGHLVTPRSGNSLRVMNGKPWAADNDCFQGWDMKRERAFSKMLGRICLDGNKQTCRFVAAPDAVGDAATTLDRFAAWQPIIASCGLPVALVAQDGLTIDAVPWEQTDALFVGGSTEFKLSFNAELLIGEAKARGKWVHIGRVSSFRRVRHFHEIGVDSIDGTCWSRWSDVYFPKFLKWLHKLNEQPHFLTPNPQQAGVCIDYLMARKSLAASPSKPPR